MHSNPSQPSHPNPAGEYIAVEKIEGVLDDSPLVDQASAAPLESTVGDVGSKGTYVVVTRGLSFSFGEWKPCCDQAHPALLGPAVPLLQEEGHSSGVQLQYRCRGGDHPPCCCAAPLASPSAALTSHLFPLWHCPMLVQIWVHGSRFESCLVAVVVPSKRHLEVRRAAGTSSERWHACGPPSAQSSSLANLTLDGTTPADVCCHPCSPRPRSPGQRRSELRETLHGCARTARWACRRALGGACAEAEGPRRGSSAVPAERRMAHCQRVPYHRPAPPAPPLRFPTS